MDAVDAEEAVSAWRYEQLLQAGWPDRKAWLLAGNPDVDLHVACELLLACPVALAWRILR